MPSGAEKKARVRDSEKGCEHRNMEVTTMVQEQAAQRLNTALSAASLPQQTEKHHNKPWRGRGVGGGLQWGAGIGAGEWYW